MPASNTPMGDRDAIPCEPRLKVTLTRIADTLTSIEAKAAAIGQCNQHIRSIDSKLSNLPIHAIAPSQVTHNHYSSCAAQTCRHDSTKAQKPVKPDPNTPSLINRIITLIVMIIGVIGFWAIVIS